MTLEKQIQLIRKIQSDLRLEAGRHLNMGDTVSDAICSKRADALSFVITTLKGAKMIKEGLSVLGNNKEGDG